MKRLRVCEQSSRVVPGAIRDVSAGQHARELLDPALVVEAVDLRLLTRILAHAQMVMPQRVHLRGVGDTEYLRVVCECSEQSAHDIRRGSADSDVRFIEHQAGQFAARGGNHLNGQTDA
ncbi:MAG: hypothetical protein ACK559_33980, partial [bacterium]